MKTKGRTALLACIIATASAACAQTPPKADRSADVLQVPMTLVSASGPGKPIGTVSISASPDGLVFTPNLSELPAGPHGYHVHETGSCAASEKDGKMVAAGAAGGHFDPHGSKEHQGPAGNGHLGDLPPLVVGADGRATLPVTAPRMKSLAEVKGRALMIHMGGDNFADKPAPLGGGGARIACGVID